MRRQMVSVMYDSVRNWCEIFQPVPLHPKPKQSRGYFNRKLITPFSMHLFLPRRKPVMDTGLLIPSENYLKKLSVKTALLSSRYVSGPSEFDSEELLRGYECKKKILKHIWFSFPFFFILGSLGCHVEDGNKNVKQTNKQSSSFRLAKRKLCRCSTLFGTFLCRHFTTTT